MWVRYWLRPCLRIRPSPRVTSGTGKPGISKGNREFQKATGITGNFFEKLLSQQKNLESISVQRRSCSKAKKSQSLCLACRSATRFIFLSNQWQFKGENFGASPASEVFFRRPSLVADKAWQGFFFQQTLMCHLTHPLRKRCAGFYFYVSASKFFNS